MSKQFTRRGRLMLLALMIVAVAALVVPFAAAAPQGQEVLVLRVGYFGSAGTDTARGAQLAIDQINNFGGVAAADGNTYRLELVTLEREPTVQTLRDAIITLMGQEPVALIGPDTNTLITPDTITLLVGTGVPVFTAATGDALTDVDTQNHIFRIRAPERVYSNALANYLVEDLNITQAVTVVTQIEFTEAELNFQSAFTNAGGSLTGNVALPNGDQLPNQVQTILQAQPEAVVMWGAPEDAALLRELLEANGYGGVFAYRFAEQAARAGILPDDLAAGMLGFDAWSYASPTDITKVFLRDYIVAFGDVPGPLAAAGYDAMWFLWSALREGGPQPGGLLPAVINLPPQNLVQGVLHPREFLNGDLARLGVVYELGPHGGPTVVARFDDVQRLGEGEAGGPPPEPTAIPPTQAPVEPTATLDGVWIEVVPNVLNVRTGPDFVYTQIGQVNGGERYRVMGQIADGSWLVIDYQGNVGWVKTEYTLVLGNLAEVAILQPPPTPIPPATPTPAPPQEPDIVIDTVVLNPAQPVPGQPFTATVTVRNAGAGAAPRFAVAATWEPGSVFTAVHVEGLAGGQVMQVQMANIVISGTGVYTVTVVADLNNEVAEANEANNTYNITYRADTALHTNQNNLQLNATTDWDLDGGVPDIQWDGYNLAMRNGAKGSVLAGHTYDNVHYDMLTPASMTVTTGFSNNQVLTNAVFGLITAEGRRAVIRVDNRQGEGGPVWISYRVYA